MRSSPASDVSLAFLTDYVYANGLFLYLLSEYEPQFVSKFFADICAPLRLNHITTTAYNP